MLQTSAKKPMTSSCVRLRAMVYLAAQRARELRGVSRLGRARLTRPTITRLAIAGTMTGRVCTRAAATGSGSLMKVTPTKSVRQRRGIRRTFDDHPDPAYGERLARHPVSDALRGPSHQEVALPNVRRQGRASLELGARFLGSAELPEEVATNRRQQVIRLERWLGDKRVHQ